MEGSISARPQLFSMPKQANGTAITPAFSSGVSSFAFQGTNSHVILGAAVPVTGFAASPALPAWQRQYIHVLPPMHPQLGRCTVAGAVATFEAGLAHPALSFYCDHQVSSKLIFPGAGYMEMVAAVGNALLFGNSAALMAVATTIAAPLILPNPATSLELSGISLRAEVRCASGAATLLTGSTANVTTTYAHLQGARAESLASAVVPTEALAAECTEPLDTAHVYERLAAGGLQYGPAFRLLRSVKQGKRSAAAKVRQQAQQQPAGFFMDPAVLDNCLQLGGMVPAQQGPAAAASAGATYIPATLAALFVGSAVSGGQAMAVAQRPLGASDSEAAVVRDHVIIGANGRMACQIQGLESRSTSGKGKAATGARAKQDMLYDITWEATGLPQQVPAEGGRLLALPARSRLELAALGIAAVQTALGEGAAILELQTHGAHDVHAVPAGAAGAAAGQLWGMLRTVIQECPGLSVSGSDADALAPATRAPPAAFRLGGSALQAAFDGYGSAAFASTLYLPAMKQSTASSSAEAFQLLPMPRGSLSSLAPQPVDVSGAKPGQMCVAVKAVGLNFRQVLLTVPSPFASSIM